MFTLIDNPTYWWPVQLTMPSATKPGEREEVSFEVLYRHLGTSEHDALCKELQNDGGGLTNLQLAQRLCAGWRGVMAADGSELAYGEAALTRLLDVPGAPEAICRGYRDSRAPAAEKNS